MNLEDDIEDEVYAKVKENNKDYVVVSYYSETSMTYKGARLYELEERDELVQEENLSEHHQTTDYFKNVKKIVFIVQKKILTGIIFNFHSIVKHCQDQIQ